MGDDDGELECLLSESKDVDEAVGKLLDEAQTLDDLETAMPLYERALALDPEHATVHYNIGLVYKYRGAWADSLHHNRIASDLREGYEAANWNMGIAATALRDWPAAREAWRRAGIAIAQGEGPIEEDFGMTPVRLNPEDRGEVVWARRIDPVRAIIANIPYASSGFREGDIVLHDGAAVGQREVGDRIYSVFNVLELFEASALSTYEAEVRPRDQADLDSLVQALDAAKVEHEVWTTNMRVLCKQCSEGLPHEHHEGEKASGWPDSHVLGISATSPDAARRVLETWSAGGGFLSKLVRRANAERLLRFECALAGPAVH